MGGEAVVCERYDLAEKGETLESINSSDLALLIDARADVECVRIKTLQGPRTADKLEFLGDAVT